MLFSVCVFECLVSVGIGIVVFLVIFGEIVELLMMKISLSVRMILISLLIGVYFSVFV